MATGYSYSYINIFEEYDPPQATVMEWDPVDNGRNY